MMGLSVGDNNLRNELDTLAALLEAISDPKAAQQRLTDLKKAYDDLATTRAQIKDQLYQITELNNSVTDQRKVIEAKHREVSAIQDNVSRAQNDLSQRENALNQRLNIVNLKEVSLSDKEKRLDEQDANLKSLTSAHVIAVNNFEVDREKRVAARMVELDTIHNQKVAVVTVREKEANDKISTAQKIFEDGTSLKAEYEHKLSNLRSFMKAI